MEIIFIIFSMLMSVIAIYIVGRSVNTHTQFVNMVKNNEFLRVWLAFTGMLLAIMIFMTVCALNNTFWHYPYLNQ